MDISFYMPFKPLGHSNPSGDLIIGTELFDFFSRHNHTIKLASRLRSRWLFLQPWRYPGLALERHKIIQHLQSAPPDIWLSYHTYYKAPDLLGPYCTRKLSIPYAVFQGIYSTKPRKRLKTLPGFLLNRVALEAAQVVFTNKKTDELNLKRLLPDERVSYIPPGVLPSQFVFDLVSRRALRTQWSVGERRVVMTTAMLRPGVKTIGVQKVIESCADLRGRGHEILLVIIGDGVNRAILEREGKLRLQDNVIFLGKIPRLELYRYYSAADVFAFPGIQESLGMVYLEAQSSGLPVVAFEDWGASEAILHEQTGLLAPAAEPHLFTDYIERILNQRERRIAMREAAKLHIRGKHDASKNFQTVLNTLERIVAARQS